jgi:hypothetical protein
MSFEQWIKEVNDIFMNKLGLGYMDIADWYYRDAYDDELTPLEAAECAFNADDLTSMMGLEFSDL